jgi:heptosyltransferase III
VETGILIVHPGALGDVLQAVPALRALRLAHGPACRLVFAGQPRLASLLVALGGVHEARSFDGLGLSALFTDAPLPEPLRALLGRFARVVSWFGSRDPTYRARLTAAAPDVIIAPPVPEADVAVWRHLLATLGIEAADEPDLVAPLRAARTARVEDTLVVHPGGGGAWKRWPADSFAAVVDAVARRRALRIVIHEGPADHAAVDALATRLTVSAERLVQPELPALAAVLAGARAYLGGDSGISHLAAAMGAPALVLFPPSTRRRWEPWSPTARAVETTGEAEEVPRVTRALERLLEAGDGTARSGLATGPAPG